MANKNTRASRYAAPIGGVFIVLCVIGLISLVGSCFSFTQGLLDNSNAKHDYENMLLPVIMFDPPPFEDPQTMREVDLLTYSVWAAVLGDKKNTYEYDDSMSMVIPASDVDMAAFRLFGPNVTLSHNTFGDYEISYLYDTATKSYHVPVTVLTGFYIPRVEEITKKDDVISLKVGYIPPMNALNVDLTGTGDDKRTPDKRMIYELHKNGKEYFLYAIRDVEGAGYLTGSDNSQINDLFDEFNDPDYIAEDPADQMQFLPQSESSDSSSGSSSDGGDSEPTTDSGDSEAPPEDSENAPESVSVSDVEG